MAGGPKPFGNSRLKFQPLRQSKLEKLEVMSATQQYLLLLGLALGILGAVLSLYGLARSVGPTRQEPGKDVPASAGVLSRAPVWTLSCALLRLCIAVFGVRYGDGLHVPLGGCVQGSRAGCFT